MQINYQIIETNLFIHLVYVLILGLLGKKTQLAAVIAFTVFIGCSIFGIFLIVYLTQKKKIISHTPTDAKNSDNVYNEATSKRKMSLNSIYDEIAIWN